MGQENGYQSGFIIRKHRVYISRVLSPIAKLESSLSSQEIADFVSNFY